MQRIERGEVERTPSGRTLPRPIEKSATSNPDLKPTLTDHSAVSSASSGVQLAPTFASNSNLSNANFVSSANLFGPMDGSKGDTMNESHPEIKRKPVVVLPLYHAFLITSLYLYPHYFVFPLTILH